MSSFLKGGQKKSYAYRNKKAMRKLKKDLLEMNKVYYELLGEKEVTSERVAEVSSYDFNDIQMDMIIKDLNSDENQLD